MRILVKKILFLPSSVAWSARQGLQPKLYVGSGRIRAHVLQKLWVEFGPTMRSL